MKTSKSGCGCAGGGGTKSAGGCGCGGNCGGGCSCKPARLPEAAPAICSPCETASFVRPRFFAGQLLTEDDLGAVMDYVVAKNRFRNSRLFGEGVVCGLEVECGPCDGQQIIVRPGYALDCCGNDLVLTCERTLEIAPMVRALAALRDGGCTDPCPPVAKPSTSIGKGESPDDKTPNRHYCLYAKYAERMDQPVAAYPVGDDCDAASCEPTRVVEGIVFELRCPSECKPRTAQDVMKECANAIDADGYLSAAAVAFKSVAVMLPSAAQVASTAYTKAEIEAMREGSRDLEAVVAQARGADRALAYAGYLTSVVGPFTRRLAFPSLELPSGVNAKAIDANASAAASALDELGDSVAALTPLQAETVRAALASYRLVQKKDYKAIESQAFLYGGAASPRLLGVGAEQLDAIAVKLKQYAGCGKSKVHTDCTLDDLIDHLEPGWSTKGDQLADYTTAQGQLAEVSEAIKRFLIDCKCAAFNPECPSCDDMGVLLACFEVKDCKVVKICNAARCYVLAPTTLRWWGLFDTDKFLARCCGEPKKSLVDDQGDGLVAGPRQFLHAPQTEKNLAMLDAVAAPSNLHERLVPKLAIPDPRIAHEVEIASLRRQLAAVTRRLDELDSVRVDKVAHVDKKEP